MRKCKFKLGDVVMLNGNPYDESIPGEAAKWFNGKRKAEPVVRITEVEEGFLISTYSNKNISQDWFRRVASGKK